MTEGGAFGESAGAGKNGLPPTVFLADPSAEAERISQVLRTAGYLVADVPLSMLYARIAVQRPDVVLLDVDAEGALACVSHVRELPDAGGVDFVFFGNTGDVIADADDALDHDASGFFARPVDIGGLLTKLRVLTGGPELRSQAFRSTSTPPPSIPTARHSGPHMPSAQAAQAAPAPPQASPQLPVHSRASSSSLPPARGSRPPSVLPPAFHDSKSPSRPPAPSAAHMLDDPERAGTAMFGPISPELQQMLDDAEKRVVGQDLHEPAVTPEEEIEAVLPAEVLAALDEPLEDESVDESAPDVAMSVGPLNVGQAFQATSVGRSQRKAPSDAPPPNTNVGSAEGVYTTGARGVGSERISSGPALSPSGSQGGVRRPSSLAPATSALPGSGTSGSSGASSGGPSGTGGGYTGPGTGSFVTGGSAVGTGAGGSNAASVPSPASSGRFQDPRSELRGDAGDAVDARGEPLEPDARANTHPLPPRLPPDTRSASQTPSRGPSQTPSRGPSYGPSQTPSRGPSNPPVREPEVNAELRRVATGLPSGAPASQRPKVAAEVIASQVAFARIVATQIRERRTCAVCLDATDGVRRIVLFEGDIVTAASGIDDENLVSFLVSRGDLSRSAGAKLSGKVPPFGRHAGAALVAHGHISQDGLWSALRAHAEWVALLAMKVTQGSVSIEPEPPGRLRGEPSVFGGTTGASVFMELVRRAYTTEGATAALGGLETRIAEGAQSQLMSECGLDAAEERLVLDARGGTLAQLLARSPEREVAAVALGLSLLGVIEPVANVRRRSAEPEDPERDREIAELDEEAVLARVRARRELVEEGDYFAILGVSRDATGYEIRRAFLELRRAFEPARLLTPRLSYLVSDVKKIVVVLEEAYEILRDPPRRERYRRAIDASPGM